jgi:hypothetical protein
MNSRRLMGSPFRPQTASYRTAEKESCCAAQQILLAKDRNGSKVPESSPVALSQNSAGPPKPDLTVRLLSRIVPALRSASAYFPFPGCASRFGPFAPEPSRGAGRLGPGVLQNRTLSKHQVEAICL